jgi:hypothetical protein
MENVLRNLRILISLQFYCLFSVCGSLTYGSGLPVVENKVNILCCGTLESRCGGHCCLTTDLPPWSQTTWSRFIDKLVATGADLKFPARPLLLYYF